MAWNTASGVPATISRRAACSSDSWSSVSASTSNFALDDDNPSAAEPQRTLVVTLPFEVGYEYKITPTSNLKSFVLTSGNPDVAWDNDYTFTVVSQCYADINDSGAIDVDDLIAVILGWGACPSPPTTCPADIMPLACGNGIIDVDDMIEVILKWGACPLCDEEGEGGGESMMSSSYGGQAGPPEADWESIFDCLANGSAQQQAACLAELAELLGQGQ